MLSWVAGCEGCFGDSSLEVGGDSPYVRCLAAPAPDDAAFRVGSVSVRRTGRELVLAGLEYPVRIAAFAGPGFGPAPGKAELDALRAQKPQLLLLLGDAGDNPDTARDTLAALAQLPVPTLVLAGGRDTPGRIESAMRDLRDAASRIIDITRLRAIRVAGDTFIPVAGAHAGRYALDASACGYADADLDELAGELELGRASRRWLLAWEAPATHAAHGVSVAAAGLSTGSSPLAELAEQLEAKGGLFAWPHHQLLRPSAASGQRRLEPGVPAEDLQLVVPRVSGQAMERADGSRVLPGFALLELDARGLRLVSTHALP